MRRPLLAPFCCLAVTGALAVALPAPAHAAVVSTERVSVAADGTQGNADSILPSTDAAGRFVVFQSDATNLVADDDNGVADIFLVDRENGGSLELISRGADGKALRSSSGGATISANGQFITYYSWAGTTAEWPKVYVYDRVARTTEVVPTGAMGAMFPSISGDGRYVMFESSSEDIVPDANGWHDDIFRYDRHTRQTSIASRSTDGTQANNSSTNGVISADGRHLAFASTATNLVPDDTNDAEDLFVKDLTTGAVKRVSVARDGSQGADFWLYDDPSVSADGRYVTYATTAAFDPADANDDIDVYLHDTASGQTTLVSRGHDGKPLDLGWASSPVLSGDGDSIGFWSNSDQVVAGDDNWVGDFFVYDRVSGVTERVSVTSTGGQADGAEAGVLTHDGRLAFYRAGAENLVPGDTNGMHDIFVTRRS